MNDAMPRSIAPTAMRPRLHARAPYAPWRAPLGRRSGVIELAGDGREDEAGRLRGLAAELLALVLLERDHEVGEHQGQRGGAREVAGRDGGLEGPDGLPRVVDDVALLRDALAKRLARCVGFRAGAGHRWLAGDRLASDRPSALDRSLSVLRSLGGLPGARG